MEDDLAHIESVVIELCSNDSGLDWTAIGSIGAILAGLAAIWAILANNRPHVFVKILAETREARIRQARTFRSFGGFRSRSDSLIEIEIINIGSRRAHGIKVNTGEGWLFFDLEPGEKNTVDIHHRHKTQKVTYGHWRFSLFRYTASISNNLSRKRRSSWRSGNLNTLEGRKRLRLFLQLVAKNSSFSDLVHLNILKKKNGLLLQAYWNDVNKNRHRVEVMFSHKFRAALIYFWPVLSLNTFTKDDYGYELALEPSALRKILRKHYGFWKFEICSKMDCPTELTEKTIIEKFRNSRWIIRLSDQVSIVRSTSPRSKSITFVDRRPRRYASNLIGLIDLNDDKYITEIGRYVLIFNSEHDFLLFSAFSLFPSRITVIDNKHRIIIHSGHRLSIGKVVFSEEQWSNFKTAMNELSKFTVNRKRNEFSFKSIIWSFFGWVSYAIYRKNLLTSTNSQRT